MIRIAKIINTHALKGEVKLYLYTDSPQERFVPGSVFFLDDGTSLELESFRMHKGLGYARFKGVADINAAEKLKGRTIEMDPSDLPAAEEGEYYYHQLEGCTVYNQDGEDLGTVTDILETGANLVLRVKKGKEQFLLPFVSAHVRNVDPEDKTITIEEMAGLR